MPKSYLDFLDHCNSWELNHVRWGKESIDYSWHSRVNWPKAFEDDVIKTFQKLQRRHGRLVSGLSVERASAVWIGFALVVGLTLVYFFRDVLLSGS